MLAARCTVRLAMHGHIENDKKALDKASVTLKSKTLFDADPCTSSAETPPSVLDALAETRKACTVLATYLDNAKRAAKDLAEQEKKAAEIPVMPAPDPPIDSMLHSVQFIVTYGASVAPNWNLALFKGPAATGNLASASGVRTHLLNIAVGPRTGGDKSQEQNRLIANQNILLTRPSTP